MSIDQKKGRLASLLRDYRVRSNLTGRALAKHIGLNPTSLFSYIDEISYPTPETRAKIARAIGMTPPELEAHLDDIPVQPLQPAEQIKQDIRALNQEDFLEVIQVVFDRLLHEMRSRS